MNDITPPPSSTEDRTPSRPLAATAALSMAGLFILLLLVLHVVRPDLDPSWHMISEYANGPFGGLMSAAFFALSGALFAMLLALLPVARGWLGVPGLVFLMIAGIGAAMGGLFPTDPPGIPPDHPSKTGMLHGLSFMLGVPGTLFGVTFINARLWRHPDWRHRHAVLLGTAALVWLTMIVFAIAMATYIGRGATGSAFLVGWQNRALVVAWALWVIALARHIRSR